MATTWVKPPAAALSIPLRSVSFWLKPGSRRWACRSIQPGERMQPLASITSGPPRAVISTSRGRLRPSSPRTCTRSRMINGRRAQDAHTVLTVDLGDSDLDPLPQRGGDVLADVIRPDGKLAMSAVDQHRQLDRGRAPGG